ncbi:MAG: C1 family peptidase [Oligoflexia bacterium]|nr:C1 family peptidase [Oligoflexia bacterium]
MSLKWLVVLGLFFIGGWNLDCRGSEDQDYQEIRVGENKNVYVPLQDVPESDWYRMLHPTHINQNNLDFSRISEIQGGLNLFSNFFSDISEYKSKHRYKSLRDRMTGVRSQQRGTCNVFAAIAILEFELREDLSEQCLAYFSSGHDGGSASDRIQWAKINGVYTERDCPFSKYRNDIPDLSGAKKIDVTESFEYKRQSDDSMSIIKKAIDKGYPITASVWVSSPSWDNFDDNSMITMPSESEIKQYCSSQNDLTNVNGKKRCGAHEVVITGYDEDTQSFEFKNSWGTKWKDGGYGRISYDYWYNMRMGNSTHVY